MGHFAYDKGGKKGAFLVPFFVNLFLNEWMKEINEFWSEILCGVSDGSGDGKQSAVMWVEVFVSGKGIHFK